MVKIHGLVYIIIGIIISIPSVIMKEGRLKFFLYIGILFIIIGAVKLFLNYTKKEKKPKNIQTTHKFCPRCGKVTKQSDQFCSNCGNLLR